MIVNGGKLANVNSLRASLATTYMILFTNNLAIVATTVYGSLTVAAWTGYAAVLISTMGAAAISGVYALSVAATAPVFTNGSGSSVTYYGWATVDSLGSPTLLEATNLGLQTLLAGASVSFPYTYGLKDVSE